MFLMKHLSSFGAIPDILNRESIFLDSDGFRLKTCRNDGTVFDLSPSLFTPYYLLNSEDQKFPNTPPSFFLITRDPLGMTVAV